MEMLRPNEPCNEDNVPSPVEQHTGNQRLKMSLPWVQPEIESGGVLTPLVG